MFEITDEQFRTLTRMRGGCTCFLGAAPCSACSDPITNEEMEKLGTTLRDSPSVNPREAHACERVNVGFNSIVWACKHCGRNM